MPDAYDEATVRAVADGGLNRPGRLRQLAVSNEKGPAVAGGAGPVGAGGGAVAGRWRGRPVRGRSPLDGLPPLTQGPRPSTGGTQGRQRARRAGLHPAKVFRANILGRGHRRAHFSQHPKSHLG